MAYQDAVLRGYDEQGVLICAAIGKARSKGNYRMPWNLYNPRERFWAARTKQLHSAHMRVFDRF
jgi:hypothetical protein